MTSIQGLAQSAVLKKVKDFANDHGGSHSTKRIKEFCTMISTKEISLASVEKASAKGKLNPFADFLKANFSKLDTDNNQMLSLAELAQGGGKWAKGSKNFKPAAALASNALSLITGAIA